MIDPIEKLEVQPEVVQETEESSTKEFHPLTIVLDKVSTGHIIAHVPDLPGLQTIGLNKKQAVVAIKILVLQALLAKFETPENRTSPTIRDMRKAIKLSIRRQRIPSKLDKLFFGLVIGPRVNANKDSLV